MPNDPPYVHSVEPHTQAAISISAAQQSGHMTCCYRSGASPPGAVIVERDDIREASLLIERRHNRARRELFEKHRQDLLRRLSHVCEHFTGAELDMLTRRMTRLHLKYEPVSGVAEPR